MPKLFKIILLGDGSVGKTTSIRAYMDEKFSKNYSPTIGVDVSKIKVEITKKLNNKSEKVSITVWDIAGQETFKNFRKAFYNGASAGILMFDVTVKESFVHIQDWLNDVLTEIGEPIPFILVGNKIDLKRKRKIKSEDMQSFQENHQNIVMQYETSAKKNENIKELFKSIAQIVLDGGVTDNKEKSKKFQFSSELDSANLKKVASARPLPASLKPKK